MNLANRLRFAKIKPFNLVELGKLLYEGNVLNITTYFYEEVIHVLQLRIYYFIKKVTLLYYYYFQSNNIM